MPQHWLNTWQSGWLSTDTNQSQTLPSWCSFSAKCARDTAVAHQELEIKDATTVYGPVMLHHLLGNIFVCLCK